MEASRRTETEGGASQSGSGGEKKAAARRGEGQRFMDPTLSLSCSYSLMVPSHVAHSLGVSII